MQSSPSSRIKGHGGERTVINPRIRETYEMLITESIGGGNVKKEEYARVVVGIKPSEV